MSEPVPLTTAGRKLFTDIDPLDMLESDGVTWGDVVAIEREAANDNGFYERFEQLRDEYQRFYDYVADCDAAIIDAWHFGENNKPGGLAEAVRNATIEPPDVPSGGPD